MKVSFFGWEVSWNRSLTIIDQLKRRGWNMPNMCYLYKKKEETSDHLILFCKKATMPLSAKEERKHGGLPPYT